MDQHHDADRWLTDTVARYEGRLILYAQRLLAAEGGLSRARDVVQETFLKLCRTPREQVAGHEAAWLYTVCRRTALDVKRKERRMSQITDDAASTLHDPSADPSLAVERNDSADQVMRMLERLPENQREAIVLKFGHGLSYAQIAQITGHTVSNVGFLIHAGLKAVRSRVAGATV
ncbi:MAG TPA: RNA polymerase sigma factor [Tepidisphaeraceae bacterium]|jgi:RNA polymerase sigma-70 factor (ECF subfamily)